MNLCEAFEKRFGFEPPDAYRLLAGSGEAVKWPVLPDFHWLTGVEVAAFQFGDHQWPDFIPFARNGQGDLWCWCPGQANAAEIPVGLCPVNCEEGEVYAPDFASALFRLICDGAQHLSSQPPLVNAARALLHSAAENPLVLWPAGWIVWFRSMADSPLSQWRTAGGIVSGIPSRDEYERALREWVDDGEVGSVFRWMDAS